MTANDFGFLQSTWKCLVSGSFLYGRVVDGKPRFAYCFGGNDKLTGHFFDLNVAGDGSLVARFQWANGVVAGYTCLKRVADNRLEGGWWSSSEELSVEQQARPARMVSSIWVRQPDEGGPPEWAEAFFALPGEP